MPDQLKEKELNIQKHFLTVPKTARYASYGILSEKTKYFWFALHGSKMLCEQMIYKFSEFDPETHFVIAPEGLSRYYMKGFGGDVVSSWMTKRDRLHEIEDFSNYLSTLYNKYFDQLHPNAKKSILAFSQGGTTAYRWLHAEKIEADVLIAYSCWIPEDIDLGQSQTKLNALKSIYTYGIQDEYLTPDRIEAVNSVIGQNKLTIEIEAYEGDHRINRTQLHYLFKKHIQ